MARQTQVFFPREFPMRHPWQNQKLRDTSVGYCLTLHLFIPPKAYIKFSHFGPEGAGIYLEQISNPRKSALICVLFWIVFRRYHISLRLPRTAARHLYYLILHSLQGNMHPYTIRVIKALYQDGDLGIEN